jgi:cytosine/adenosine deaminase-related metal-dependent hydrolase
MNTQAFDIAIRHARLRGSADRHADIGIKDGRITAIAARLDGSGATEIDAGGNQGTGSFVNPHLHLCKVWTLPMMEEEALRAYQGEGMGKALSGIELVQQDQREIRRSVDRGKRPPRGCARGVARQPAHPRLRRC